MSDDQQPLFQDSDELERTYAPQQLPNAQPPDDPEPLIPVRADTSQNQPVPLPPHDPAQDIPDTENPDHDR